MQREWFIAWGGLALAAVLWFQSGLHSAVGDATTFIFTIVPADAEGLACSAARQSGERCEFDETNAPQKSEKPLRPFVTTSGEAVLLSGVFEEPTVAAWLETSVQNGKNDRVTVTCSAKLGGAAKGARIRFQPTAAWSPPVDLSTATVSACVVH